MEGYTKIKNTLITSSELDEIEFRILVYLISISKKNICYPSFNTMSKNLNISKSTVIRKVKSLEVKNFISKETRVLGTGKKTSNVYLINEDAISKNLKEKSVSTEPRECTEEELKVSEYDWISE